MHSTTNNNNTNPEAIGKTAEHFTRAPPDGQDTSKPGQQSAIVQDVPAKPPPHTALAPASASRGRTGLALLPLSS